MATPNTAWHRVLELQAMTAQLLSAETAYMRADQKPPPELGVLAIVTRAKVMELGAEVDAERARRRFIAHNS